MDVNDYAPPYYKSAYQHWDFAIKIGLSYLEGCATKYVVRWREKEGVKDLWKAMRYLDKILVVNDYNIHRNNVTVDEELDRFATANSLGPLETQYTFILCTYRNEKALKSARQILSKIINEANEERYAKRQLEEINRPGTPEDGGHHSRQDP